MRRAYQQILGSITATVILTLLALTPVWISDTLEPLEVEQQGLIPTSSVISESNTSMAYSPYIESSPDNMGYMYWTGGVDKACHSVFYDVATTEGTVLWNALGDMELYRSDVHTSEEASTLQFYFEVEYQDWVTYNINSFYLQVSSTLNYKIQQLTVHPVDTDWKGLGAYQLTIPAGSDTYSTGITTYTTTFTSEELTNAASYTATGCYHKVFKINLGLENYHGEDILIRWMMNPEYYEETTTTWNNQTITVYEPYIQTFSNPHVWQEWSLGAVGVLFILTAAVINPIINPSRILQQVKKSSLPGSRILNKKTRRRRN